MLEKKQSKELYFQKTKRGKQWWQSRASKCWCFENRNQIEVLKTFAISMMSPTLEWFKIRSLVVFRPGTLFVYANQPQPNPTQPQPPTKSTESSYVMLTQSWEKLPASSGGAQVKGSQVLIGSIGPGHCRWWCFFHLNIPGMFETKPQQKKPHLHLFAEH